MLFLFRGPPLFGGPLNALGGAHQHVQEKTSKLFKGILRPVGGPLWEFQRLISSLPSAPPVGQRRVRKMLRHGNRSKSPLLLLPTHVPISVSLLLQLLLMVWPLLPLFLLLPMLLMLQPPLLPLLLPLLLRMLK